MEEGWRLRLYFCIIIVFMCVWSKGSVEGYKNYTVGDSLGWFDRLEKSTVNYEKWVSGKTFSLGDFLIFNTDNNHTVVQTYNSTTYHLCDYSNALDNDTFQWASPDPSASTVHPVSVAVPLLKVRPTYFFSGDYDGEQCENGQRFKINVTYGQGLPPSLKTPAPGAPGPVSQRSGDDDSVPETLVPANFDHPKDISSDDEDDDGKKKTSNATFIRCSKWELSRIFILLGLIYTCL